MFDNPETETDIDVDVEKAAQTFRRQYPDAPAEAAELYEDLMLLNARLDDVEKARQEKAEIREELETEIRGIEERLDQVVKAMFGSTQVASDGADDRATKREAIRKEQEVFTR